MSVSIYGCFREDRPTYDNVTLTDRGRNLQGTKMSQFDKRRFDWSCIGGRTNNASSKRKDK